jgi:hypothetical protein
MTPTERSGSMEDLNGITQKTREYFYGLEEKASQVVDPSLLVIPEKKEDIQQKILEIKKEIENFIEKEQQKRNALLGHIEEAALPQEIKVADQAHVVLEQQLVLLKDALKEKMPRKRGTFLGNFLGF